MTRDHDEVVVSDQTAQLEQGYITEFLQRRGYTFATLRSLPQSDADALMKEASVYASARLTEVESRAHYVHDIHHAHDRRG
ncbi:MAG: hypothetical protein C5B57_00430 [Blastocatellia bacterium]|nr:MAG: hypothetical protein C5B57_00430 [Blastocatellia bacterium]